MKRAFTTIAALAMLSLSACTLLQSQGSPSSSGKPSSAMAKLHFPKHWIDATRPNEPIDDIPLSFIQQMEVRRVPKSDADEYFFAALPNGDNDYRHEVDARLPKPQYSLNFFAVKFSSPPEVRPATKEEWDRAAVLRSYPPNPAPEEGTETKSAELPVSRQFPGTGKVSGSPPAVGVGEWVGVFSYDEVARDDANENVFVDLYNQRTRDKFLSTTVSITGPANDLFRRARGIDGGYIILPLSPRG